MTTTVNKHRMTTKPPELNESELVAQLVRGDPRAFDLLVEQYQHRVAGLANRLLGWTDATDDVVQDVFVTVLDRVSSFEGRSSLWTWLARITINRCRTWQRRTWLRRKLQSVSGTLLDRQAETPTSQPQLIRDETAAEVRTAVRALPAKYREVIVLRYLEELPIEEVAELLELSRGAVDVRLTRARGQLAARLKHLQ